MNDVNVLFQVAKDDYAYWNFQTQDEIEPYKDKEKFVIGTLNEIFNHLKDSDAYIIEYIGSEQYTLFKLNDEDTFIDKFADLGSCSIGTKEAICYNIQKNFEKQENIEDDLTI